MGKVIGIDLGTTNSCVAVLENDQPVVITNAEGSRTTPSVVAFTKNGERLVGDAARRQAAVNVDRTFFSIKREMGSAFRAKIDGKQYTPQEISAMILRKLKKDAEEYLGKAFPDKQSDAYLLLKFDGNSVEEIEEAYAKVAKLCLEQGALDVLISDTEEREESIWKARGAFLEAIKGSTTYMDEVDMVVPRNCVNDMVVYLHNLQKEKDIRIKSFGHAGDGNLHAYILKDDLSDEEWEKRMKDTMEKIYQKAHELRGQVSGEHGIGFAKKPYLRKSLPTENLELMNGIKKVFDPKNILNPHKVAQL